MKDSNVRQNSRGWPALGAILLGFVCIVIGFWVLTRAQETISAASVAGTPTAQKRVVVTNAPTLSPPTPTAQTAKERNTVEPTATVTAIYTPAPSATAHEPAAPTPAGTSFHLTIVHSNDTWGYTQPCG